MTCGATSMRRCTRSAQVEGEDFRTFRAPVRAEQSRCPAAYLALRLARSAPDHAPRTALGDRIARDWSSLPFRRAHPQRRLLLGRLVTVGPGLGAPGLRARDRYRRTDRRGELTRSGRLLLARDARAV